MISKRKNPRRPSALLPILCAALLISLGFAHRPVTAAQVVNHDYYEEQFRLPDGTFSDICHELHDKENTEQHPHANLLGICEACILASSLLLPTSDDSNALAAQGRESQIKWHHANSCLNSQIVGYYLATGPPNYFEL